MENKNHNKNTAIPIPKCDSCDRPATHAVRDVARVTGPLDTMERYEKYGKARYGCNLHPVESREYDMRSLYF